MRRVLLAIAALAVLILFFAAGAAFAQSVLSTLPVITPVSPEVVMPVGSPIHVNRKTLVGARNNGKTGIYFGMTCDRAVDTSANCDPSQANGNVPEQFLVSSDASSVGGDGDFRLTCRISHQSYDDPIVWPGHPGITHLHTFVGNTSTSFASVLDDFSLVGSSTCTGGMVNASGYWFPTPIYHCPSVAIGCDHARDGEVQRLLDDVNVYYKCTASGGGLNCTTNASYGPYACNTAQTQCTLTNPGAGMTGGPVHAPPVGYRYIVGNASSRAPAPARVICSTSQSQPQFGHFPSTAESLAAGGGGCTDLNFGLVLPQCWDGQNIDSPGHSAHAIFEGTVPGATVLCGNPAFPIRIMTPQMNVHMIVKSQADYDYIRLSADPPCADEPGGVAGDYLDDTGAPFLCNGKPHNGQPAGWTNHMDWANGWNHAPNAGGFGIGTWWDVILKGCVNLNQHPYIDSTSCHDNLFGSPLHDGKYYTISNAPS